MTRNVSMSSSLCAHLSSSWCYLSMLLAGVAILQAVSSGDKDCCPFCWVWAKHIWQWPLSSIIVLRKLHFHWNQSRRTSAISRPTFLHRFQL
eukprot:g39729.t1